MTQCLSCKGKKIVTGLGFIRGECRRCKGTGDEPIKVVSTPEVCSCEPEAPVKIINAEDYMEKTPAKAVQLPFPVPPKRRGRPPKKVVSK